jgi:hypothetical protein
MSNQEIKQKIQKYILGLAKDEQITLTHEQVFKGVEDIFIYLNQRSKDDQLFMLKGNESQDIYDAAKQWFFC